MNYGKLLGPVIGLTLVALSLVGCGAGAPVAPTGKITGVVINNTTGNPEESLSVILMYAKPGTGATELSALGDELVAQTDSQGAFTIDNIEPGTYGILMSRGVTMESVEVNKISSSDFPTPLRVSAEYYVLGTQIFGFLLATEDGNAAITIDAGQVVDLGQVPYVMQH